MIIKKRTQEALQLNPFFFFLIAVGSKAITERLGPEIINPDLHREVPWHRKYFFWIEVALYTTLLQAGQAVATMLSGLYFANGGNSKWLATLLQIVGFPVLLPFLFISPAKDHENEETNNNSFKPSLKALVLVYVFLGILLAVVSMFYSLGLKYLPVSTYSLICASQLAFNALFSLFFNAQKLTPFILNSIVLLTISSALLVIQKDSEDTDKNGTKHRHFAIGFACTLAASFGYSLMLSLTELAFQKVFRKETLKMILDMCIYQNLAATVVILIGFFVSGDWKTMHTEMQAFKGGKVAYVMNIFWTAVSWQVFNIGCLGLILKVSSLFSNAISVVGYPVTPILAVIFLKEKITGVKVMSLLLGIWGLLSYLYQNYLDDLKNKAESSKSSDQLLKSSLA